MHEFEKLKQRLKNVGKNTTEYRMTVEEARDLVKEITNLQKELAEERKKIISQKITKELPSVVTKISIMDGGTF